MALLSDTETSDIRSRLLDVEKLLTAPDRNPDDHDGYAEALLTLAALRNQCLDLGMFHSDPEEVRVARKARGQARIKFEADQEALIVKARKDAEEAAAKAAAKEAKEAKDLEKSIEPAFIPKNESSKTTHK